MSGSDYSRVERAIQYLESHCQEQPGLAEVARHAGLSEFHFQRLFQRWAGVSPKAFLQCLTLARAKRLLEDSRSLLDTSLEVGLSGAGRLHDLFLSLEAMTPGDYKQAGASLVISWSLHDTPFGPALFAATEKGLCALSFLEADAREQALRELQARWPAATLVEASDRTGPMAREVVSRMQGGRPGALPLLLKGSPFQIQVWKALLMIPEGRLATYQDIARLAGSPRATRAVGSALAVNPIGYLIPCHRVIRATGAIGDYHWGSIRKLALLGVEGARRMQVS